jgi:hypothetical protein
MTRKATIFMISILFLIFSATVSLAELQDEDGYSIDYHLGGSPQGNHQLDCTLILPWTSREGEGPVEGKLYPVIAWANGWGWNEVAGEDEILGYLPGMIEWAVQGQFIVIAANQWSPRERDVLQGVAWLMEEYKGLIDEAKIGLAGHSQGGGAVLRASDGEPKGKGLGLEVEIATVIAMNPYGPSWNEVNPDGPVLIVGGFHDTTTPPGSYLKAWQQIEANGIGGINATEMDGDHNNNAWAKLGEEPEECNFGEYQELSLEWWKIHFNNEPIDRFCEILLIDGNWDVRYSPEFESECPLL